MSPTSIQRCIDQLEILAPAIEEMDFEFQKTRNAVQNDSAAKRSLEYSRKAVETLDTLVRDMEKQISAANKSRRLVAQLKVRVKKHVIEDHQQRLTSALQLLSLSQQTYLIALSRAQPEMIVSEIQNCMKLESQKQLSSGTEDDKQDRETDVKQVAKSPGYLKRSASRGFNFWSAKKPMPPSRSGFLGTLAFQSYEVVEKPSIRYIPATARFFQARLQIPWFLQSSWDLTVLRASSGWTFQLNTWNIRPEDAEIFKAVGLGNARWITELVKSKEASLYDRTPWGSSLLMHALWSSQIESIRVLVSLGMSTLDINLTEMLNSILLWSWSDLESVYPLESVRIWAEEIGGITDDECMEDGVSGTFWQLRNFHKLLPSPRALHQLIGSLDWSDVDPAIPLEMLRSGLVLASDFTPCHCSSKPDQDRRSYLQNFIWQYFHALLNRDRSFQDWRSLTRKIFIGLSAWDIVHPHYVRPQNLVGVLRALWQRQFALLSFERWIQMAMRLWLEDLADAKIDLEEYMKWEMVYSREYREDKTTGGLEMTILPGMRIPESGPSLSIISFGQNPEDWRFSWDPCVEELSASV
ncbi:hypothetical protein FBEOM_3233 [Fusarium beomiforme]|uniref:Uncharacterized protein n=1 Tax=Fusarium beomiforme TaxID=44412 RepID=A0A9P5E1M7_9HYPO|nr:hypothetical protein FBEOM_3233 [Fusarium beomiforme]